MIGRLRQDHQRPGPRGPVVGAPAMRLPRGSIDPLGFGISQESTRGTMNGIRTALVTFISASCLLIGGAASPAAGADASQPQPADMSAVFERLNGPNIADVIWVENHNRVSFASSSYCSDKEFKRVLGLGVHVAQAAAHHSPEMNRLLLRLSQRISIHNLHVSGVSNGVRVTLMVTFPAGRLGWDVAYVR
jgi:hypothetical protein